MQATVLYCAGLVDGTGQAPLRDAALRIEDGRVKAVGPIEAYRPEADRETIEHDFRPH
jgi:N-acyl-D-aspartate/D-glutamate deacylase